MGEMMNPAIVEFFSNLSVEKIAAVLAITATVSGGVFAVFKYFYGSTKIVFCDINVDGFYSREHVFRNDLYYIKNVGRITANNVEIIFASGANIINIKNDKFMTSIDYENIPLENGDIKILIRKIMPGDGIRIISKERDKTKIIKVVCSNGSSEFKRYSLFLLNEELFTGLRFVWWVRRWMLLFAIMLIAIKFL